MVDMSSDIMCGGCQRFIDKTEWIDDFTCDYCVEHEDGCQCTDCVSAPKEVKDE